MIAQSMWRCPYAERFAESEAVWDLKPLEKPLTLANYYVLNLRPIEPKLLEAVQLPLHYYLVTLVSDKNKNHVGLNRAKQKFFFGKFCKPNEFKKEVEIFKILEAAERQCPHIIKLQQSIMVNPNKEGFIITPRYKPYSSDLLRPHMKEVMRQLLQAISCCHASGIVHRDIKPWNIVWEWNEEQQKPHIYLTDFGVAATLEHLKKCFMDTTDGTFLYRAPERMLLIITEDPKKMDLWSAGVTFAEMLLGYDSWDQTLFEWGDKEELAEFQTKRDSLFKDIDPVARDLLDKLLAVDVTQRLSADEALMHPYFNLTDKATVEKILPNVTIDSSEQETSSNGMTHSKDESSYVVATFSANDEETRLSSPDVTKNLEQGTHATSERKRKRSTEEEKGSRKKKRRDS